MKEYAPTSRIASAVAGSTFLIAALAWSALPLIPAAGHHTQETVSVASMPQQQLPTLVIVAHRDMQPVNIAIASSHAGRS